ncbi:MAG TPA: NADH-ubiquinone oxidoreductase-F iron-sulfur binding region domain-containing protein [Actinocrinis sp.]|nr:NADH-ubiquinone oxidoreductase-F iron-sulfur binding region domain-containing protein [Actinocrinis sp.]
MTTHTGPAPSARGRRSYGEPDPARPARRSGPRLLAGWYETGGPAALGEHLRRYGAMPLSGPGGLRPAALIDAVEQAGLTGRGGAAFPTGRKLRTVAGGRGGAVVVANAMESEPSGRKDQTLLNLAPHLVLDGIALAAHAVGARQAHLCLPRSRAGQADALRRAVDERWNHGLDPVAVDVHELPHNYVSSEESALVRWLGGGPAKPASVPPRPFERGVDRLPTLVDNVETLAHLALIARYGPGWFRSQGAADAPGTTLVTLSGALARPGVFEADLGTPLGEVITLGGLTARPRAVLLGGFFGSWLPADQAWNLPYSAPAIAATGGGIGAGIIAVLPEGACGLAETARILDYLAAQSAGQCGPCRFGLPAVARDLADLAHTRVGPVQARRLQERIGLLAGRGACKHPDGASRLAASALRVFAQDARHHLAHGPCPAARDRPPVIEVPRTGPIREEDWR